MLNFRKVFASLIVGVGAISVMSGAQAETMDLEDVLDGVGLNPYVSPTTNGFEIQAWGRYPEPFPFKVALKANGGQTSRFNDGESYLTMGQGLGAIVVRSTTLDELFDVVSIDLGSGRDSDHTDITVTAVDASGSAIISKEFFNQYELAAHGLTGFVRMASLEITAVKPGSTTRVTFSFDDIHIVPSILAPTYSCLGFDSPMANGAVKVKKNRALPHKAELVDADGFPITDLDIAAPPVIMVTYYSNETGAAEETLEALSLGNATEGNQFVLSDADEWQFNLSTKSYSSVGTYYTKMVSGDASEYLISPNCEGSFEIQ